MRLGGDGLELSKGQERSKRTARVGRRRATDERRRTFVERTSRAGFFDSTELRICGDKLSKGQERTAWFRTALLEHVCGLPGLSCEGRRKPPPELSITVDGSGKPRGVVRPYEGDEGVDLAYLFGKQHDLTTDVFRESLTGYLCTVDGVACARTRAKVSSRSPADIFGGDGQRRQGGTLSAAATSRTRNGGVVVYLTNPSVELTFFATVR